ncbi:DUF397 domain-containing protein [Actinomadura miaoliensis]|uniref:DUF397 domain-containing protein n=1 Tax=Actinomadura miaoliensis TaxID=430685 RepID=A0ABP7VVS0_9ACTN
MSRHYTNWRKSRHSQPNGNCVEIGRADDGTIGIRDTKQHGTGPILEFTQAEWATLVHRIRTHQLNT